MSKPNTVDSYHDGRIDVNNIKNLNYKSLTQNLSNRTAKRRGMVAFHTTFDTQEELIKHDKTIQRKAHSSKIVQERLQAKLKQRAKTLEHDSVSSALPSPTASSPVEQPVAAR
jgi:hypothetical protein